MPSVGAAHFWMNQPPTVDALPLRRVPLLAAAVAFAAGEVLALHWHPTWVLALAVALLLSLSVLALRWAPRVAAVPVLAAWLAAGCWCAQMQPPIPTQHSLLPYADGLSRTVRGRVLRVRAIPVEATPTDSPDVQHPWQLGPGAWEADRTPARQSVDIQITAIEFLTPDISRLVPASGGVRVTLLAPADAAPLSLHCGQVVELPLRLRTPELYADPGAFSEADYLLQQGIGLLASARSSRLRVLSMATPEWSCQLFAAQSWAADRMQAYVRSAANHGLPAPLRLSPDDGRMLDAMLFGDRSGLTGTLREGFERTGTFHLFVVSGLHVAMLVGALFWLLRRLRLPAWLALLLTLAVGIAYTLLTGWGVPSRRALLMVSVYLLARVLSRRATMLNAFGAAALAVLVLDPRSLFTVSFQMTFLVVLAVAGVAVPLSQAWLSDRRRALERIHVLPLDAHLRPQRAQLRVRVRMMGSALADALPGSTPRWVRRMVAALPRLALWALLRTLDAVLIGLCAELCMALPMAVYFHRATLLALPLNLVEIPLLALLLACGVTLFAAELLSSALQHSTLLHWAWLHWAWLHGWLAAHALACITAIPAAATALLLHLMRGLVDHLLRAPLADVRMPAPLPLAEWFACAAIAAACLLLRSARPRLRAAGCVALVVVGLAVFVPPRPALHAGRLEVTALDVGQGDSLLVVSPDGHTLLVDAGGPVGRPGAAPASWDVGEQIVAPYLWSRRIGRLDAVLLTHAHSDHMGGMPAVLRDLRPHDLYLSLLPAGQGGHLDSPNLRALLQLAASLHIQVHRMRAGDRFAWHGLQASVLAPEPAYRNDAAPSNDDSLVLRLDDQRASVLLEGDAEASSEDSMLQHGYLAPATLLKVGHHGSKTSTNPEFLAAVQPRMAVISVGRYNTFGHPRAEVLARLEAAHVKTFRTDREGAETFLLAPDGTISTASPADPAPLQW